MATISTASGIITTATNTPTSTSTSTSVTTANRSSKRKLHRKHQIEAAAAASANLRYSCSVVRHIFIAVTLSFYRSTPTLALSTPIVSSYNTYTISDRLFPSQRLEQSDATKQKQARSKSSISLRLYSFPSEKRFNINININSKNNINNKNKNKNKNKNNNNNTPNNDKDNDCTAMLLNTVARRQSNNLRGLFAGAGAEGLSNPLMVRQVLELLPEELKRAPSRSDVNVLYVGTATYDLEVRREQQTRCFIDEGCTVESLDVALSDRDRDRDPTNTNTNTLYDDCVSKIERADVIVVGGGNTLYAFDRWKHLGLIPHFRKAMERDCVMTGGSAGAICWFHSGHSDSADPDTYADPMLRKYGDNPQTGGGCDDESSTFDSGDKKDWKYLRVPGMGFVPGNMICCPHHDRIQSNGLLRADDFDTMLLKRASALLAADNDEKSNSDGSSSSNNNENENSIENSRSSSLPTELIGIGIDHYAAFVVEDGRYKVFSLPDKVGSVETTNKTGGGGRGGSSSDDRFAVQADGTAVGTPGVWIKRVDLGNNNNNNSINSEKKLTVRATICPREGDLMELLGDGAFSEEDVAFEDDDDEENRRALEECREGNPSTTIFV